MPDASGWPRVLIVDDERVIADTLALILSKNQYAVKVAYSGEDAVRLAEVEPPEIVVSDVVLPGMDGIRTAVAIKRYAPQCRVLLISGQNLTPRQLQESGGAEGGFEVLVKPVHPQALLNKLRENSGRG